MKKIVAALILIQMFSLAAKDLTVCSQKDLQKGCRGGVPFTCQDGNNQTHAYYPSYDSCLNNCKCPQGAAKFYDEGGHRLKKCVDNRKVLWNQFCPVQDAGPCARWSECHFESPY